MKIRDFLSWLWRRHRRIVIGFGALVGLWALVVLYNVRKPLPDGVAVTGPVRPDSRVEFLYDLSFVRDGEIVVEQSIFDRVLGMIDSAETFIVLDMFLFNNEHNADRDYRRLARQLTDRIIARRRARPALAVTFITDPINNFYGAYTTPQIVRLREAGVEVVVTRLNRLRDSNPFYSAAWRMGPRWLGTRGPAFLPHPLSNRDRRVTARAYLKLLNFKANHRKLVVTERECLVTSANPHDASSFHSNIAFASSGAVCQDMLDSERGVARFSGVVIPAHRVNPAPTNTAEPAPSSAPDSAPSSASDSALSSASDSARTPTGLGGPVAGIASAQFLTEGAIRSALLTHMNAAGDNDQIDVAVFYLSDRGIVRALRSAARRGASVQVILDPNKDAFGRQKGGMPNRQVALELAGVGVRWYDTHGEQFHTKLAIFTRGDSVTIIGGSANYTRRNLRNYNLEANLLVTTGRNAPLAVAARRYFRTIWQNRGGHYTLDYAAYRDDSILKRALYRIQEFTGFCTY